MIRVKISCGGVSDAALDHSNPLIYKFLPGRGNVWKGCEFFFNDASITQADYWVIIGESFAGETCLVPKENVIFMACEPPQTIRYDSFTPFINQFYRLYTSHENSPHPRSYRAHSPMNWWVDAGHPIIIVTAILEREVVFVRRDTIPFVWHVLHTSSKPI